MSAFFYNNAENIIFNMPYQITGLHLLPHTYPYAIDEPA